MVVAVMLGGFSPSASAQPSPTTAPAIIPAAPAPAINTNALKGRTVEAVKVTGNAKVQTAVILNVVRTREGDKFDPATVQEDYQRIFSLHKFANVEPRVEATATGVIVVFSVTEQRQIESIRVNGNSSLDEQTILGAIDLQKGQAIDTFRIATATKAIQALYRSKNFPLSTVSVDIDNANNTGNIDITIVEGPPVRIKNINFVGNNTFTEGKLTDQIKSRTYIWIFREGTYDPTEVDDDVARIRKFYQDKGYFDVRVGRKLVFSPDQTEMAIDFLIEEGQRYVVDKVTFTGVKSVTEDQIRAQLKMVEGIPFDQDIVQRDVRQIVRVYSPLGFIYQPESTDNDYMRIDQRQVYRLEPGKVEVVYDIHEGKPFKIGQILPRGNTRTQDKVVLREMRMAPGELYDSGKVQDANERLRGTPYFENVKITPIGDDPETRDLLVEVSERRTATLTFGAGINSNGGLGGNVTYEQKNFDITDWPHSTGDLFSDRSFVGGGQTFRISLEPGTQSSNASIFFREPWIFDQPYSFSIELYVRDRKREVYDDQRMGGRINIGHRFNDIYSGNIGVRGENVRVSNISDRAIRADEILELDGSSVLTSLSVTGRRDTTTGGVMPSKGSVIQGTWESFGALGGDYTFQKLSLNTDFYFELSEDLLDRKTILRLSGDAGYITGDAPVFEKFYGGGINSVRGFAFRGITPRSGPDDDRIGGDFLLTGTAEVSFPLFGETLRGVAFVDAGMVERDFEFGTIRTSAGAGVRLTLPFLGQVPIAIDFAVPITKDKEDDTQFISFSLGFNP